MGLLPQVGSKEVTEVESGGAPHRVCLSELHSRKHNYRLTLGGKGASPWSSAAVQSAAAAHVPRSSLRTKATGSPGHTSRFEMRRFLQGDNVTWFQFEAASPTSTGVTTS